MKQNMLVCYATQTATFRIFYEELRCTRNHLEQSSLKDLLEVTVVVLLLHSGFTNFIANTFYSLVAGVVTTRKWPMTNYILFFWLVVNFLDFRHYNDDYKEQQITTK